MKREEVTFRYIKHAHFLQKLFFFAYKYTDTRILATYRLFNSLSINAQHLETSLYSCNFYSQFLSIILVFNRAKSESLHFDIYSLRLCIISSTYHWILNDVLLSFLYSLFFSSGKYFVVMYCGFMRTICISII